MTDEQVQTIADAIKGAYSLGGPHPIGFEALSMSIGNPSTGESLAHAVSEGSRDIAEAIRELADATRELADAVTTLKGKANE